ncbi:MAG: hypothetical protein AAGJ79_09800 [Verrucomicrobiota bacterium]
MDVQVATLCDSASDYNGKMCILGTFDTICSKQVPVVHPHCALALRVCFQPGDEGKHQFTIQFIDADGQAVMPQLQSDIVDISLPQDAYFLTRNIVINMQRLKFDRVGLFSIDVSVDDRILARVPLRVMLLPEQSGNQAEGAA